MCSGYAELAFVSLYFLRKESSKRCLGDISNYSSLLLDADIDFVPFRSETGRSFSISGGFTYYRGALSYDAAYNINQNGVKTVLIYDITNLNNIGLNAKLRYRIPISEKLYSTFNADIYFIETFSFNDILSIGYSIGYKF